MRVERERFDRTSSSISLQLVSLASSGRSRSLACYTPADEHLGAVTLTAHRLGSHRNIQCACTSHHPWHKHTHTNPFLLTNKHSADLHCTFYFRPLKSNSSKWRSCSYLCKEHAKSARGRGESARVRMCEYWYGVQVERVQISGREHKRCLKSPSRVQYTTHPASSS